MELRQHPPRRTTTFRLLYNIFPSTQFYNDFEREGISIKIRGTIRFHKIEWNIGGWTRFPNVTFINDSFEVLIAFQPWFRARCRKPTYRCPPLTCNRLKNVSISISSRRDLTYPPPLFLHRSLSPSRAARNSFISGPDSRLKIHSTAIRYVIP